LHSLRRFFEPDRKRSGLQILVCDIIRTIPLKIGSYEGASERAKPEPYLFFGGSGFRFNPVLLTAISKDSSDYSG